MHGREKSHDTMGMKREIEQVMDTTIFITSDIFDNENARSTVNINDEEKEKIFTTTPIPTPRNRMRKKTTAAVPIVPKQVRVLASNRRAPSYVSVQKARCALCLNKIALVQVDGDYGTNIYDDIRTYTNGQSHQSSTVKLYEETTHNLRVQLDCGGDSTDSPCSDSLTVQMWVDYNDNRFDDSESHTLHRSWPNNGASTGTYDLQIYVPAIDVITTTPYVYMAPICSIPSPRIILVIMAGEVGTEIRDDKVYTALNTYENQHHMGVTLYENTIYLLRVQLACPTQLSTELTETGCNLAQEVNVWVDWNDDGNFDASEIGAPHLWPVTSYLPQGVYDIQLNIPLIDERYIANRSHRMRIVVTPDENYRRTCGNYQQYSERREYDVNIISRSSYLPAPDAIHPYVAPENITCTPQVGKIIFAIMPGEHRTQIRDDFSTRALLGNDDHDQHLSVILREGNTYLFRLQFECDDRLNRGYSDKNCNLPHDTNVWIDLNDDGEFSEGERATPYLWPLTSYLPQGVYDLQVRVPLVDGRQIKSGPHRMQLVISLNQHYRRKCAYPNYYEVRNYTVTIVSNTIKSVDVGGPYLQLSDAVCTQTNAHIVLVIMAGVDGTQIRDDTRNNTRISEYQNRHHMAVSVYENTNYRIRIQLDCNPASSRGPLNNYCNLAQDVDVLIDLNDDGHYDQSESFIPHRWPLRSSIPLGLYDHELAIPASTDSYRRTGTHHMRIVVKPSEEYNAKCGHTDIIVRVRSQLCQDMDQYAQCSASSACGCFHMTNADNTGICGFLWPSCSQLKPCSPSNNTCDPLNTVCVQHPRCNNHSVCYPISMIDERICPLISTTSSSTTTTTQQSFCPRLITFDNVSGAGRYSQPLPNGFSGFQWVNANYMNVSYHEEINGWSGFSTVLSSGKYIGWNKDGQKLSMIINAAPSFTLKSMMLASAWNDNLTLEISGKGLGTVNKSIKLTLQLQPQWVELNWSHVEIVHFSSYGGEQNSNVTRNGTEFGIDNLCVEFSK
ncbi:unnamed protein product [Adineta steineri]|uniref:GEVED domain-containing protein n=1 Tax=Adineta steineri TaxID=433720 RepID=A0A814IQ62_9BILA|nr:unnamed protein product [Adineta steineri]CAF1502689.1 unnamed protein product [Adineta steineri]